MQSKQGAPACQGGQPGDLDSLTISQQANLVAKRADLGDHCFEMSSHPGNVDITRSNSNAASDGRAIYSDTSVVERYLSTSGLQPVEALILSRIGREFADKRILDLGVGAGRTTPTCLRSAKTISESTFPLR
jgi:hypothetical protein